MPSFTRSNKYKEKERASGSHEWWHKFSHFDMSVLYLSMEILNRVEYHHINKYQVFIRKIFRGILIIYGVIQKTLSIPPFPFPSPLPLREGRGKGSMMPYDYTYHKVTLHNFDIISRALSVYFLILERKNHKYWKTENQVWYESSLTRKKNIWNNYEILHKEWIYKITW